ncbi:Regulator of telomere elongation helicase 1 [Asimina triloba]
MVLGIQETGRVLADCVSGEKPSLVEWPCRLGCGQDAGQFVDGDGGYMDDYMKNNPDIGNDPFDIEDLVNIGRTQGPCPYYVSRELHKVVDILFAPYNYLIDQGNRRSLSGINWENTVLIFDEAHNLEMIKRVFPTYRWPTDHSLPKLYAESAASFIKSANDESVCADAASFDLHSTNLSACISEAKQCIDLSVAKRAIEKSDDKSLDPDNFAILRALLLKLEKKISDMTIESKDLGFTRPGPYIYELFADLNITQKTANMLIDTIDQASLLLEDAANASQRKASGTVCRLESVRAILDIIFRDGDKSHANSYRVHVQESQANSTDAFKGKASRILSWWCFNPGIAMLEFAKMHVRSIIVTSGTLSPLDSFAQELKLQFPVQLENPHVISSNQVWVGVVPTGPSGICLNSSYRTRDSLEYKQELGNAIVNFARIVPDGLLVFFPSYYLLDQCIECWKNLQRIDHALQNPASSANSSTIWERICKHKQPVVEPKQSALFAYSIEDFKTKLNDTSSSGAIFFAVIRGKVSEGLDFADHAGRAVVITGMPFAMRTDPKIRLKREFLDQQALSQKKESKVIGHKIELHAYVDAHSAIPSSSKFFINYQVLMGEEWYSQQAARAVNQAVGRVIQLKDVIAGILDLLLLMGSCDRQTSDDIFSYWEWIICSLSKHQLDYSCLPRFGIVHCIQETSEPSSDCFVSLGVKLIMAEDLPKKSVSSILAARRGNSCNQLGEISPANRSTLTSDKQNLRLSSKNSMDHSYSGNQLQTVGSKKRETENLDCEVVDLTGNSSVDGESNGEGMVTATSRHDRTMHHSQINQGNTAASVCSAQKSRDISCSKSNEDKESKGSAFLLQVQEKLTTEEYKDFIGFMRALKSKTMKIIPVLESIARLFSSPERIHLLRRFKDYVPAKYRLIYEEQIIKPDTMGNCVAKPPVQPFSKANEELSKFIFYEDGV